MTSQQALSNYYQACFQLFKCFIKQFDSYKNWSDQTIIDTDMFHLDRPIEIADMYLTLDDIVNYYESKATLDQFLAWYWKYTGAGIKPKENLKNWVLLDKKASSPK